MSKTLKSKFNFFILIALALGYLYPWLYMFLRSFLRHEPGLGDGKGWFTLNNYKLIIMQASFPNYILNSFIVLVAVVIANIIFSLMVGYAFARYRFPFKKLLFLIVLGTLMIPKQTLMIPLLDLMVRLGLHNTLFALILPFCVDGFNIFLMKQYVENLPKDLEEAARADGANEWQILWNVITPLARPAISVIIINTAIINWNAFLFPLIFIDSAKLRTLPVALSMLVQSQYGTDWGALMAGASVSSLPIIVIFWIFQREIIEGITNGALKD